jgi:hypothetical protein
VEKDTLFDPVFENVDAAIVGVPTVSVIDPLEYIGDDVDGIAREVYVLLYEPTVYVPVFVPLTGRRPMKDP